MPAWLLPAAASLIGGFLSNRGQRGREEKNRQSQLESDRAGQFRDWSYGRGPFERRAAGQAGRSSLARQLLSQSPRLKGAGISDDVWAKLINPTAYPEFQFVPGAQEASPGLGEDIGGAISGIAPYLGLGGDQVAPPGQGGPSSTALMEYLRRYYPGTLGAATGQPGPPAPPISAPGEVALEDLWRE